MKSRQQERQKTETNKPRFQIEKLEERIAPSHTRGHYHHRGPGYGNGSGGHCGHGACK